MKEKTIKFPVHLFCSLMLLSFISFIYTLLRTNLIVNNTLPEGLGIAGHIEWFDLINETIQAFLIVPLFALLNKCVQDKGKFKERIFQSFLIANIIYILFIDNFETIKHILVILIPFYFAYSYTVLFDNILIGYGKTQYCFAISVVVNLIYYPVVYGLMLKGVFMPNITFICMMFGFGIVTHLGCSIICFVIYKNMSLKKAQNH